MRSRAAARSNGDVRPQAGAAEAAASIARAASSRRPSASAPMISPDAGLVASNAAPLTAGAHAPPMYSVATTLAGRSAAAADAAAVDFGGTRAPGRTLVGLLHPRRPVLPGAATVCRAGCSERNPRLTCHGSAVHSHPSLSQPATPSLNELARQATTHCLTGCAIGEIVGLVVSTQLGWSNAASIVL